MKIVSFVKITFILIIIFLSSCESIKRGVSGEKKKAGDEFLIEKKNPLVLPPAFGKLTKPLDKSIVEEVNTDNDIEKLLGGELENEKNIEGNNDSKNLQKSILKKIKSK